MQARSALPDADTTAPCHTLTRALNRFELTDSLGVKLFDVCAPHSLRVIPPQ